jgi:hypothetical protein
MTKTGRIGRVTAVIDDGRTYVMFGSSEYPDKMFAHELEPVSDSCHFAKGDKVRATGKSLTFGDLVEGKIGKIDSLCTFNGVKCADVRWGSGRENVIPLIQLTKCDTCGSCQKLSSMNESLEYWRTACASARRDAAYWREELDKLQTEAMAECKTWQNLASIYYHQQVDACHKVPLGEVAKIYVQVTPEKLLLSHDACRVMTILSEGGEMSSPRIAGRLELPTWRVVDAIIELRDAGRIELLDGKYQIREE